MMAKGLLTAATAMLIAAPIAAEPVKAPVQPSSQPVANVVLAAAEIPQRVEAQPVASDAAAPAAVKRPRAARVTTCRCGDSGGQR